MNISSGVGFDGNRREEIKPGNYVIMYEANINPMNKGKSSFHFPVINATEEDIAAIKSGRLALPPMSGLKNRVILKVESVEDMSGPAK